MKMKKNLIALLAGLALTGAAYADTTITNSTPWDGSTSISPWGVPDTATYGQTFTTGGVDTVLNSFSFYLRSVNVTYKAYVAEWDGSKASSIVWASDVESANFGGSGFQQVDTNTGNLQLKADTQYVAFFSTSGLQSGFGGTSSWGYTGDTISGGNLVFFNNGDDAGALTTAVWDSTQWYNSSNDLAFQATLTAPVPEPETYGMMLVGLGLLGFLARRRKQV
nr:PEP-CTERM sorting domain-containing protein [uncultured Duganella sp.]